MNSYLQKELTPVKTLNENISCQENIFSWSNWHLGGDGKDEKEGGMLEVVLILGVGTSQALGKLTGEPDLQ